MSFLGGGGYGGYGGPIGSAIPPPGVPPPYTVITKPGLLGLFKKKILVPNGPIGPYGGYGCGPGFGGCGPGFGGPGFGGPGFGGPVW